MSQVPARPSFVEIALKTTIVHTITYFVMGLLASTIFSYGTLFSEPGLNQYMRPIEDPMVMAGPLLQPIRGLLFGVMIYLLRELIFLRRNGWLVLFAVLFIAGILGPFGATPGSLEGMIYTTLPFLTHLRGLPEVILQALLLSALVVYWVSHPEKKWLTWVMGILFFIVLLLPTMGFLFGRGS